MIKIPVDKKYMASNSCRSGCLLVTIAKNRIWKHPDTKDSLDVAGLELLLQQEASKVEKDMGLTLRIVTKVLDLRPRLPTEK